MNEIHLSWNDLVCGYPEKPALHLPFSGVIKSSGIYAIRGPNGCGKSTLLKTWLGLLSPRSGTTLVNGISHSQRHDISQGIGYVPQYHTVNRFFPIPVEKFICQGFGPGYKDSAANRARVALLLHQWELKNHAQSSFHELSLGQKTRAMVARAIVSNPRTLFLDEPLASLDGHCQEMLMNTLFHLASDHEVCVVLVDHHLAAYEDMLTGSIFFDRQHDKESCEILFKKRDVTCLHS